MTSGVARIEVLDAALADQIAAGEVVERPASALKELIDNAVDAGSTRIDIEILDGGKRLIRVRDNGCGMHPKDLPLCVLRHATSKIRSAEQLLSLRTLGFRGEALASLAAVAKVSIKSRRPEDDLGSAFEVQPGQPQAQHRAGMSVGTQVEVTDLFSHIPARLKFLRAEATESAHCVDAVLSVALLHPEIAFFLRSAQRCLLEFPATDAAGRVAQVLQRRARGPFVAFEDDHEGVKVHGWLAPLSQAVRSRNAMYLAVRGRVIKDRQISRILREALAFGLPVQRYPVGLLVIEPPSEDVDVNVHPQKCEVRFSDAARVYFAIRTVLHRVTQSQREALEQRPNAGPSAGQALRQAALLSKIEDAAKRAPTPTSTAASTGRSYRLPTRASTTDYDRAKRALRDQADAMRRPVHRSTPAETKVSSPQRGFVWSQAETRSQVPQGVVSSPSSPANPPAPAERLNMEVLTVLPGPVALCRLGDRIAAADLVKIRSHLILERLTQQWKRRGALDAQTLLVPLVLNLEASALEAYLEHRDALAKLGFEVEAFGQGSLRVRSLPAVLGTLDDAPALREQLERLRPWLRLLGDQDSASPPLAMLAEVPLKDPAPRLARRWLNELSELGELESVPGLRFWRGHELV